MKYIKINGRDYDLKALTFENYKKLVPSATEKDLCELKGIEFKPVEGKKEPIANVVAKDEESTPEAKKQPVKRKRKPKTIKE